MEKNYPIFKFTLLFRDGVKRERLYAITQAKPSPNLYFIYENHFPEDVRGKLTSGTTFTASFTSQGALNSPNDVHIPSDKNLLRLFYWQNWRQEAWNALKDDDPERLSSVIFCPAMFVVSTTRLWNPNKAKSIRYRNIAEVCVKNTKGIPPEGAVKCLEWLLETYGKFMDLTFIYKLQHLCDISLRPKIKEALDKYLQKICVEEDRYEYSEGKAYARKPLAGF